MTFREKSICKYFMVMSENKFQHSNDNIMETLDLY